MCDMRFVKPSLISCLRTLPQEHFQRFNSLPPVIGFLPKKSWQIFLLSGGTVGRPREWSKELNMIELWIVEWDSWDLVRLLLGMNDPYVSQPLVLHASGTITLRTIYCNTHYWQYNILQYLLTTTQYIGIVRWPNTIYCIVRSDQYNILYCRDKPIQYIVLSGRTNTIYC
jgi:hypothetical protein